MMLFNTLSGAQEQLDQRSRATRPKVLRLAYTLIRAMHELQKGNCLGRTLVSSLSRFV